MFAQFRHVLIANPNSATLLRWLHTRDDIKQSGFSGAVTPDDGDKITIVGIQTYVVQRPDLVNCAGGKIFINILELKQALSITHQYNPLHPHGRWYPLAADFLAYIGNGQSNNNQCGGN